MTAMPNTMPNNAVNAYLDRSHRGYTQKKLYLLLKYALFQFYYIISDGA